MLRAFYDQNSEQIIYRLESLNASKLLIFLKNRSIDSKGVDDLERTKQPHRKKIDQFRKTEMSNRTDNIVDWAQLEWFGIALRRSAIPRIYSSSLAFYTLVSPNSISWISCTSQKKVFVNDRTWLTWKSDQTEESCH